MATDTNSDADAAQEQGARPRRSNLRTAAVLFLVAVAFYFGMIFIGPLSR